ncbi:MAG: T9SS type A sorting domain-containing protein [Bacteroidales bacterium]
MKLLRLLSLFSVFIFFTLNVNSQGIAIGQWRDHLPYSKGISVAEAGNKIYCATPSSVFHFDKSDNSIERLTKVNGLSDNGISFIAYSAPYKTLVITYENTNIDLLQNGSIINISDIKRKPILGNKSINKVVIYDRYAYLCCGFGIVVLDLMKNEIKDTYYIGPEGDPINVLDITHDNTTFWVATQNGIYKAEMNDPNLSNYDSWKQDTTITLPNRKFNTIQYFYGKVYANYSNPAYGKDTLFEYNGQQWKYFNKFKTPTCNNITSFGNKLIITYADFIDVLDSNMIIDNHIWAYFIGDSSYYPQPKYAMLDKDNDVWIADARRGLMKCFLKYAFTQIKPNGPNAENVFAMDASSNKVCAVPGGRNIIWGNEWYTGALYTFSDDVWASVDNTTHALMDSLRDIIVVAINPRDSNQVFAGTWGYGLCEFSGNTLKMIYEGSNSALKPHQGWDDYEVRIGGLHFDNNNNLWITNAYTDNVLVVKKANNAGWISYNLGNLVTGANNLDIGDFTFDNYGQVWMLLRGNKLLVFNGNGTLDNIADDRAAMLGAGIGNGNIPGSRVKSIATDLEGQVWLGTDEGVAVFYAPENVFSNANADAQRIYVTQDGYTQYLLETESVTAIAVDGSNKKWFGTERAGVFLMSADGTRQIQHFTEENSPLLSNSITSITIDNTTGEVFFGTENGICSYRSDATGGGEKNENVFAYPNPVEPGYDGAIAIKGLVKDASVKITDISGTLVYSTRAEGGQAVWNGRNFSGQKPNTGIYLVFVSNDDGSETIVTKIYYKN